jgi:class 3 adenylate cyclase
VGKKKFTYDIWGDAVNVAARMESNGEAGRIALSESTYHRVKERFECEHRGKIEAKNKGFLETYFLNRVK